MLVILVYKAAPCAHTRAQVRICALFLSPLKLVLQIVRQHEVGRRISTSHLIMYLVAHATRKPPGPTNLSSEDDNQTDKINYKNNVGGDRSNGSASAHQPQPWYRCQQDCQQKAHAQLLTLPLRRTPSLYGITGNLTSSSAHITGDECCEQRTWCTHKQMLDHSGSHPSLSTCSVDRGMSQFNSSLPQTQLQTHLITQLVGA
jgi:hypothetical protein